MNRQAERYRPELPEPVVGTGEVAHIDEHHPSEDDIPVNSQIDREALLLRRANAPFDLGGRALTMSRLRIDPTLLPPPPEDPHRN
jgi:hypothetical protein